MESINRKILILAVLMALVTCFLLYYYISSLDRDTKDIEYVEVFAAGVEIPARTVIKDSMLIRIKLPKDTELKMGVSDKGKLVGKLTKERIVKGEAILEDRLYKGEDSNMAFLVPKGKRAVTIGVNEVSEVGDFILPGDYVDVIATFEEATVDIGTSKLYYPKYTKVILQNMQILGIGQKMQVSKEDDKKLPTSVTLAVSLEDAEKLVLADESGVLRLALKPAADSGTVQTNGVIKDDMVVPKGKIVSQ